MTKATLAGTGILRKGSKQKNYTPLIWTLAIFINGLITVSYFLPKIDTLKHYNFSVLPLVNAVLNGSTFIALLTALIAVNKKMSYYIEVLCFWHSRLLLYSCFPICFTIFQLLQRNSEVVALSKGFTSLYCSRIFFWLF